MGFEFMIFLQRINRLVKAIVCTMLLCSFAFMPDTCSSIYQLEGIQRFSPDSGTLIIGRNDTLLVDMRYFRGQTLGGQCGLASSFGVGTDTVGNWIGRWISASTLVSCEEQRTSKLWLLNDRGPVPGSYKPYGGSFTLYIIAENSFGIEPPDTLAVTRGVPRQFPVRIIRPPGFTDAVQLSLQQHLRFTATFTPIAAGRDTSIMQLTATAIAPLGYYDLVVNGTGGGFTGTGRFTASVGDAIYQVQLSPSTIALSQGQMAPVTIHVSGSSSHVLPVTLSVPAPPAGVSFQFTPPTTSFTSVMTVAVGPAVQPGPYPVQLSARFANDTIRTATLNLTVNPTAGWIPQFQTLDMRAMDMWDATQTGLAVNSGGTPFVFRSTDAGRNWVGIVSFDPGTYYGLSMNGQRAVIVGINGACYLSLDAGTSWSARSSGTTRSLQAVSFSDVANAVAVGQGVITRTTNGGDTWSVFSQIGDPYDFWDVSYLGGSAFAVGLNGIIFRATGYSNNWSQQSSGTTANLWGVSFVSTSTGMAVGDGGTILYTTDAGATWAPRPIPGVTTRIQKVAMLNETTATVGGFGARIYQTTDAGLTWTQDNVNLSFDFVQAIHLFPNNSGLCLITAAPQNATSTILRRE